MPARPGTSYLRYPYLPFLFSTRKSFFYFFFPISPSPPSCCLPCHVMSCHVASDLEIPSQPVYLPTYLPYLHADECGSTLPCILYPCPFHARYGPYACVCVLVCVLVYVLVCVYSFRLLAAVAITSMYQPASQPARCLHLPLVHSFQPWTYTRPRPIYPTYSSPPVCGP